MFWTCLGCGVLAEKSGVLAKWIRSAYCPKMDYYLSRVHCITMGAGPSANRCKRQRVHANPTMPESSAIRCKRLRAHANPTVLEAFHVDKDRRIISFLPPSYLVLASVNKSLRDYTNEDPAYRQTSASQLLEGLSEKQHTAQQQGRQPISMVGFMQARVAAETQTAAIQAAVGRKFLRSRQKLSIRFLQAHH